MTLSQAMAQFAVDTKTGHLPASALAVMELSLLDWCAVAIAGIEEPVSRVVRNQVLSEGGIEQAGVLGSNWKFGKSRLVPV